MRSVAFCRYTLCGRSGNNPSMRPSMRTSILRLAVLVTAISAAGCQLLETQSPPVPEAPPAPPPIEAPLATHQFVFDPQHDEVIGTLQMTHAKGEDTLPDIARRFNLGYEEIVRANPGVDPWLPGEGTRIVLPTQFVLPNAPREGLVINLAQLRMYYFPEPDDGAPHVVITHPIGIGKVGWSTPEGTTEVTAKARNPTWFPPSSVRKEHAEAGDPLPSRVPPGPDNPLGAHVLTLGWPSYLVHGTNKPYGVGLRSSHGCVRFYPEDIAGLYGMVPVGTKVTVVNQPFVFGWQDDALYVQAFPVLEDDTREHPDAAESLLNAAISGEMWQKVREHNAIVDLELVNSLVAQPRGIAVPVSRAELTMEKLLYASRHVENTLPKGANWNGSDDKIFTAEEIEAARIGTPLPTSAPRAEKKTAAAGSGGSTVGAL